jgi:hypothetical protein
VTERKPPGLSTGSWIDTQIRRAQEAGEFDDLPGMGKPIPGLHAPETDLDYLAKIARRENLDVTAFLPPALALAKEVEQLPDVLRAEYVESRVRERIADLNTRIEKAIRAPQQGPPMRTRPVDVEATVEAWRASRPATEPPPAPAAPLPRRRWWRR